MFDERSRHYRTVSARLRDMAERTRFADLRAGYLDLAARFERLAERAEHPRSVDMPGALRIEGRYQAKPES
jgi:hypothetical protein